MGRPDARILDENYNDDNNDDNDVDDDKIDGDEDQSVLKKTK